MSSGVLSVVGRSASGFSDVCYCWSVVLVPWIYLGQEIRSQTFTVHPLLGEEAFETMYTDEMVIALERNGVGKSCESLE